jgi:hypothetical protein
MKNKIMNQLGNLRHYLRKTVHYLKRFVNNPLPTLVLFMAQTGFQTDECLEEGALPVNVHFYSPIPDINDLKIRNIFEKKSRLEGIDFRISDQLDLLKIIGNEFGIECDWPYQPTDKEEDFYLNNNCFSFGCAASLHSMIRHYKPKRIIEIGSGFSSRIISKAIELNSSNGSLCNYQIIDPYPNVITETKIQNINSFNKERVELVDPKFFCSLEENDILFIDSGHTTRIGGDVNFMYLDILPTLKKGVIIHIHDINLPYEYPEVYCTNPAFRVFWTEAYLLQAFLCFNSSFEILLAMNFIQKDHIDRFCEAFPKFELDKNWANSGSFWIRKTK